MRSIIRRSFSPFTHSSDSNPLPAGAIAATLVAAKALGAKKGHLLHYTTSYDEKPEGPPRDFVGYASLVFG